MRFSLLHSALFFQLRIAPLFAGALPEALNGGVELQKRGCNQDNVLRALEAHRVSALAFCSNYNGISTSTVFTVTPTTGVSPVV